jgi:hypothetical protein
MSVSTPVITPIGVAGTTTYGYTIVVYLGDGKVDISLEGRTVWGNAVLSSSNYNYILWNSYSGALGYWVFRTTSQGSPGSLGNIMPGYPTGWMTLNPFFDDLAYIGDGALVPLNGIIGMDSVRFCENCKLVYRPDPRMHWTPGSRCPRCGYHMTQEMIDGTRQKILTGNFGE